MKPALARLLSGLFIILGLLGARASEAQQQFLVVNVGSRAYSEVFAEINRAIDTDPKTNLRLGVAAIFSYLGHGRAAVERNLQAFLKASADTGIPVVVQLDGENWWQARPDLWNWWDASTPGYSPSNRFNVEWSGWSSEDAIKIAWRNWGHQLRVLPPPNLMSPRFREACDEEMRHFIPIIHNWWKALPAEKNHLLIGIKVGWESSIGVNAWYYPDGNRLLSRPEAEDPTHGLTASEVPARGVAQIGYAAVKTAGLRHSGKITEADLAEIARRHLENLCRTAGALGVPRDRLFTHVAGWREEELLYGAAVNKYSCPGWSFYQHAADATRDLGIQKALQASDAPYWGAVEWLLQGKQDQEVWQTALQRVFSMPRCRYLCIYNWEGIRHNSAALNGIRNFMKTGTPFLPDN